MPVELQLMWHMITCPLHCSSSAASSIAITVLLNSVTFVIFVLHVVLCWV